MLSEALKIDFYTDYGRIKQKLKSGELAGQKRVPYIAN